MINAFVFARAAVHYAREWVPLSGTAEWLEVNQLRSSRFNHVKNLTTELVNTRNEVILLVGDLISHVPGTSPEWAIERNDDGTVGSRPNGVVVAYSFPREHVERHGLPTPDALKSAFHADAVSALTKAYAEQKPGPATSRTFPPSALAPADRLPSGSPKSWGEAVKKNAGLESFSSKRGLIFAAATVGVGAIIGITAWRLIQSRHEDKSSQQGR